MFDAPIPADQVLSVSLTASEWNIVMGGLSEMPFKIANSVINKLQEQLRRDVMRLREATATE